MAFEQYFASQGWKPTPSIEPANQSPCFDCNICLEYAREPVVTLCGHLYCWPCIYKWLHVQSSSLATNDHPQCPVCKSDISHEEMVPLYGRGQSDLNSKITTGIVVPPRPTCRTTRAITINNANNANNINNPSPQNRSNHHQQQQLHYRNPYQTQFTYEDNMNMNMNMNVNTSDVGFHHSMVGMFGEMFYTRVFGNSEAGVYGYPNSYQFVTGSSTRRLRRQEIQADKSLNRISIFLFCCFLLCLIVF